MSHLAYPSHSQVKSNNSARQHKQYSILPVSIYSDILIERSRDEEVRILESHLFQLERDNEDLHNLLLNSQKALDEVQYKNQNFTEKLTNLVRLERNTSEEINDLTLSLKSAENQIKLLKNELKAKQDQDFAFLSAENIGLHKKLNDLNRQVSDQKLAEVTKQLEKDKLLEQKSFLQDEFEFEQKKSIQLSRELSSAELEICKVPCQEIKEENQFIKSRIQGAELKLHELESMFYGPSSISLEFSSKKPLKVLKSSKSSQSSKMISNPSAFSSKSSAVLSSPKSILKKKKSIKSHFKPATGSQEDNLNDKAISLTISKIQSDLSDLSSLIQKTNQNY